MYTDNIRLLYMDLLALGVSTEKIKPVIEKVQSRLTDSCAQLKLPKSTFSKYMLNEVRSLSFIQSRELFDSDNVEHMTLCTDATKKRS